MESSTTRISDLPETESPIKNAGFDTTINYIPINVHPNPYGISAQNPIMPIPQQQPNIQQIQQVQQLQQIQQQQQQQQQQQPYLQQQAFYQNPNTMDQLTDQHQMELQSMKQVRLPSRDIPRDTTGYVNDEQIQPNYIPKKNVSSDYVRDYEEITEKKIREHEQKKYRENRIDDFLNEFQTPIFIILLYFLFQLPIVNTMIFKRFSFLSVYNLDGNFNLYGLILKSLLFGGFYYMVQKITTFIVEI